MLERNINRILGLAIIHLAFQGTFSHYTNEFAVEIEDGDPQQIASDVGCSYDGHVVENVHQFSCHRVQKRSVEGHAEMTSTLLGHKSVKIVEQQKVLSRKKRQLWKMPTQAPPQAHFDDLVNLNDDRWAQMWYLNRGNHLDMNVQGAWMKGVTGKGISVTILDDGIERTNPDLVANYDPLASYDVNQNDNDPTPRYDLIDSNKHGTRCAGEVAASANNSLCSVGIAYEAGIGGVRMLDGDVTDAVEARSIGLNNQHIDVYSASWGPDDDGRTVDGPGRLATRAFVQGISNGRGGKGSIFVWASGNGGRDYDNCNCDGYTNSIYTLSVSSATENGLVPWYSEACSSSMASTYSSGSSNERKVVTTDLHHSCTSSHTGTSASAPLAAGIVALTLHANPKLTWRDTQHITIRCAHKANLRANDWSVNGVGRNFSHSFGYGLMDASCMVDHAMKWKEVPEQKKCSKAAKMADLMIQGRQKGTSTIEVDECSVKFLEHVQAHVSLGATKRGDVQIFLISPAGTKSTLIAKRPKDYSRAGFNDWPFLTVHMWEESPLGTWTLEVVNDGMSLVELKQWSLTFWGTESYPQPGLGTEAPMTVASKLPKPVDVAATELGQPDQKTQDVSMQNQAAVNSLEELNQAEYSSQEGGETKIDNCKETSGKDWCLKCAHGFSLLNGRCLERCPEEGYYLANSPYQNVCNRCYYSCKTCSGANDYECLSCFGDAEMQEEHKGHKFCRNKGLLNRVLSSSKWYNVLSIGFLLCFCIILLLIIYIVRWRGNLDAKSPITARSGSAGGTGKVSKTNNNSSRYAPVKQMTNGATGNASVTIPFHDYDSSSDEEELFRKPYSDNVK